MCNQETKKQRIFEFLEHIIERKVNMSVSATLKSGGLIMDKKIINISSKRQITIPQKFYEALHFTNEAECVVRGNELVIRPARNNSGGEFAENILEELVSEGFSGKELIKEFKKRQSKIRPAVEALINEADTAASGNGMYYSYSDVFGSEDDNG